MVPEVHQAWVHWAWAALVGMEWYHVVVAAALVQDLVLRVEKYANIQMGLGN
jgi:hypothetical protein